MEVSALRNRVAAVEGKRAVVGDRTVGGQRTRRAACTDLQSAGTNGGGGRVGVGTSQRHCASSGLDKRRAICSYDA